MIVLAGAGWSARSARESAETETRCLQAYE